MVKDLFPDDVLTVDTASGAAPETGGLRLHPEEAALIARAGPKRKREFTMGRLCARRALAGLGIEDHPLLVGPDRMPLWPDGIIGSLSHCGDFCAVAVARREEIIGLGLDVEKAGPLDEKTTARICGGEERARAGSLARRTPENWSKLIFSAKESVYKCYYPLTGNKLWFQDVEITADPDRGTFVARLRPGAKHLRGLETLRGRFSYDETHVYTGVTLTSREAAAASSARRSPSR